MVRTSLESSYKDLLIVCCTTDIFVRSLSVCVYRNFFIFIRPRYHSVSRRNRNAHTIALLRQIIFSAKPKQEQRDCPESHVVDLSNKTESVRVHSDDNLSTDFTPELHLATETPTGGEKRDHGGEPSIITGGATA